MNNLYIFLGCHLNLVAERNFKYCSITALLELAPPHHKLSIDYRCFNQFAHRRLNHQICSITNYRFTKIKRCGIIETKLSSCSKRKSYTEFYTEKV